MRIGVVGGGLMGLALAHRLGAQGHSVTVFERADQLGGLSTHHDFGGFEWDRFYHVILPSDLDLIGFLREIGLGDALRWQTTRTGFYIGDRFHSVSTSMEFLRFPALSLWAKMRLALTILYCARIEDWRRLERVSVEDWLIRISGRATYEAMWKPLLLAKLGEHYRRVSAVFIWTYIKRMYSARDTSARREQLGHVRGGYKTVFTRLAERIAGQGGEVRTGVRIERIGRAAEAGLQIRCDGTAQAFDRVVLTTPVEAVRGILEPGLLAPDPEQPRAAVEYLGVVCLVLVTRKPVTPFYVLNIAEESVPFTGVIGMSNVVATEETGGCHLTYLPKYVLSSDPLLDADDTEIKQRFMQGFDRLYPDFDPVDIVSIHVNRARRVQPLQVIDYSRLAPRHRTGHPDLLLLNTAQFVNNTLNNNEAIRAVERFHAAGLIPPAADPGPPPGPSQ